MHRFYTEAVGVPGDIVRLAEEDARHASRVLRMRPGEACELFMEGARFAAQVDTIDETGVACRVVAPLPSTEAALRITLYQGLPKADKMELIIQKAVELGAERIVPVAMSRCVVQLNAKDGAKKQERWQKIAREASKQSGRCMLTQVDCPISFKELLHRLPNHERALVPWEDASGFGLKQFHAENPDVRDVAIVIGPEGGMSESEIEQMQAAGCRSVTLGPRILRTETAGLASISALLCLFGDMA